MCFSTGVSTFLLMQLPAALLAALLASSAAGAFNPYNSLPRPRYFIPPQLQQQQYAQEYPGGHPYVHGQFPAYHPAPLNFFAPYHFNGQYFPQPLAYQPQRPVYQVPVATEIANVEMEIYSPDVNPKDYAEDQYYAGLRERDEALEVAVRAWKTSAEPANACNAAVSAVPKTIPETVDGAVALFIEPFFSSDEKIFSPDNIVPQHAYSGPPSPQPSSRICEAAPAINSTATVSHETPQKSVVDIIEELLGWQQPPPKTSSVPVVPAPSMSLTRSQIIQPAPTRRSKPKSFLDLQAKVQVRRNLQATQKEKAKDKSARKEKSYAQKDNATPRKEKKKSTDPHGKKRKRSEAALEDFIIEDGTSEKPAKKGRGRSRKVSTNSNIEARLKATAPRKSVSSDENSCVSVSSDEEPKDPNDPRHKPYSKKGQVPRLIRELEITMKLPEGERSRKRMSRGEYNRLERKMDFILGFSEEESYSEGSGEDQLNLLSTASVSESEFESEESSFIELNPSSMGIAFDSHNSGRVVFFNMSAKDNTPILALLQESGFAVNPVKPSAHLVSSWTGKNFVTEVIMSSPDEVARAVIELRGVKLNGSLLGVAAAPASFDIANCSITIMLRMSKNMAKIAQSGWLRELLQPLHAEFDLDQQVMKCLFNSPQEAMAARKKILELRNRELYLGSTFYKYTLALYSTSLK